MIASGLMGSLRHGHDYEFKDIYVSWVVVFRRLRPEMERIQLLLVWRNSLEFPSGSVVLYFLFICTSLSLPPTSISVRNSFDHSINCTCM